jgi:hypothetical protein
MEVVWNRHFPSVIPTHFSVGGCLFAGDSQLWTSVMFWWIALLLYVSLGSPCLEARTELCPKCSAQGKHNTVTLSALAFDHDVAFKARAGFVIELARNFSAGVVLSNEHFLHSTIQYLCCFNDEEYTLVAEAIRSVPFPGFSIGFDTLYCSQGYGLPNVANLRVQYNATSQRIMGDYVAKVEGAMRARGLNVTRSRADMVPFHVSLVEVDQEFPVEEFLAFANKEANWTAISIDMDQYVMIDPPHIFTPEQ